MSDSIEIIGRLGQSYSKNYIYYDAPTNGEIRLNITLNEECVGLKTFFCVLGFDYFPILHVSFDGNLFMGRFNTKDKEWKHCLCEKPLEIGKKHFLTIYYGRSKNDIFLENTRLGTVPIVSESMRFELIGGKYLSFGDLSSEDTLPNDGLFAITNFSIRERYISRGSKAIEIESPNILTKEILHNERNKYKQ